MIAYSSMALMWAIMAARRSIPRPCLQVTINLFNNWLLGLTLTPRRNEAIMGFTRPLWIFLGHFIQALGSVSPTYSIDLHGHEGQ